MLRSILLSAVSFAGTNIDDIFISTVLFAKADTRADVRRVVVGKFLATGILTLFSILGAGALKVLPDGFIPCLGIIPILLGVKELFFREDGDSVQNPRKVNGGLMTSTALVAVASGADNVSVYVPLFAGFGTRDTIAAVAAFALLTALWCRLGKALADLPRLRDMLKKHGSLTVSTVYIFLGIYIILRGFIP